MIPELSGLVVCGGRSSRMGTEKGLLVYHQLPQQYHACHLLEPFCKMVYLGCNPVQAEAANPAYAVLPDHPDYAGLGPLTAVLSFRRAWPGGHLLLLGCDYPLVDGETLRMLVDTARTTDCSAAFRNASGITEPLVALLHDRDLEQIFRDPAAYGHSLRKYLDQADAHIIPHPLPEVLISADTPEDCEILLRRLKT